MVSVTSRSVAVLGSTGSIGTQALEVIAAHPRAFTVAALTAGGNVELLARQAVEFDVPFVAAAAGSVEDLRSALASYAAGAGRAAYAPEVVVGADAAAFAEGVVRVYRDPRLWAMLSENGMRNLEQYFSRRVARQTMAAILQQAPRS